MPELLVMRHAKSAHPAGIRDHDRPLSRRGEWSAAAVGRTITSFGAVPDLVLTSSAQRALTTAHIASDSGDWGAPIEVVDEFYGGGVATVLTETSERWRGDRVLIVGHEPIWSSIVSAVIDGGSIQMVTAAVACIELMLPPGPGSGWLRWMIHPRLFEG